MGRTGVRHAGHYINIHAVVIPFGQGRAAVIAHLLNRNPLITGGRIAVVDPEEGADPHLLSGIGQCGDPFRGKDHDLTGSQFLQIPVAKVQIGEGLEGGAAAVLFLAQDDRGPAITVPGTVDAVRRHQQDGHGAVDQLLGILNALHQVILLVDDGRGQFRRVNGPAAHFQEMGPAAFEDLLDQLVCIVDLAHCADGVGAMVGTDDQGLGLKIRDTADAQLAFHASDFFVKFCSERGIFDIMNRSVETQISVIDRHAGTPCAQMRMIVCTEIQVKHTIRLGSYSKKSTHRCSFLLAVKCGTLPLPK